MSYRNSSHTGRAARDLQSAFGPYTSHYIVSRPKRFWTPIRIALTVTYACAIALMAYLLFTHQ